MSKNEKKKIFVNFFKFYKTFFVCASLYKCITKNLNSISELYYYKDKTFLNSYSHIEYNKQISCFHKKGRMTLMKYCSKCGGKLNSSDAFCAFCGAKQAVSIESAIDLAKAGDTDGFEYLYNTTYKHMKFCALKYVDNNDQDADDIVQDSYVKMMNNINSLGDSKGFYKWMERIVSNTAIDFIRKRDRKDAEGNIRGNVNFSDLAVEDADGEIMEYEVEDDNPNWHPEVAYTQKETKELVHAMMENLSDEQKNALIMFHIQGMSIKEIAEITEVSENTVKSRLNYARKSVKAQGEALRKKGYKLYSYAPLPLLLYLIRLQMGLVGGGSVGAATA